jgi:hypothetical protein
MKQGMAPYRRPAWHCCRQNNLLHHGFKYRDLPYRQIDAAQNFPCGMGKFQQTLFSKKKCDVGVQRLSIIFDADKTERYCAKRGTRYTGGLRVAYFCNVANGNVSLRKSHDIIADYAKSYYPAWLFFGKVSCLAYTLPRYQNEYSWHRVNGRSQDIRHG